MIFIIIFSTLLNQSSNPHSAVGFVGIPRRAPIPTVRREIYGADCSGTCKPVGRTCLAEWNAGRQCELHMA